MVRVDFDFGVDLWVLGAIVRHWNQHGLLARLNALFQSFVQASHRCGLFRGFFIPCPEDERAWEDGGNLRHEELACGLFVGFFFRNDHAVDMGFAWIGEVNPHGGCCRWQEVFWAW